MKAFFPFRMCRNRLCQSRINNIDRIIRRKIAELISRIYKTDHFLYPKTCIQCYFRKIFRILSYARYKLPHSRKCKVSDCKYCVKHSGKFHIRTKQIRSPSEDNCRCIQNDQRPQKPGSQFFFTLFSTLFQNISAKSRKYHHTINPNAKQKCFYRRHKRKRYHNTSQKTACCPSCKHPRIRIPILHNTVYSH